MQDEHKRVNTSGILAAARRINNGAVRAVPSLLVTQVRKLIQVDRRHFAQLA